MKKAILVVSYGTVYPESLSNSIEALEYTIQERFPGYTVRRAFTGKRILEMLDQKQMHVDSVDQAFDKLIAEGYDEVFVQPTHVIGGSELESVSKASVKYKEHFKRLNMGAPLLHDEKDFERVGRFFEETFQGKADAIAIMGHGTDHRANVLYEEFEKTCLRLGFRDLFVATLEAKPSIEDIILRLKTEKHKTVIITPLLVTAGGHASVDMAGDGEKSWKSRLKAEGFMVEAVVKGLGEYEKIREIYVDHLADAIFYNRVSQNQFE